LRTTSEATNTSDLTYTFAVASPIEMLGARHLRSWSDARSLRFTYARCMHRVVVATVLAVAALLGFTSCSQTTINAADAYKIGCPAVDAAAESGSMVNKVTVAGLKKLSQSGKLDPEPQRWVDATISLLESDNPKDAPSDVKKLIVDGCAKNGYPLQNLH
jgi:hypothetical protein